VPLERFRAVEESHAEPLAGTIVLGDEAPAHRLRRQDDRVAADRGDRVRHADPVARQRRILRDLADLEPKRAAVVDHAPAVRFQPREDAAGQLGGVAVAARVRRGAHPVVEDARRRFVAEIERPVGDKPFGVRQRLLGEGRTQRLDPGVVFVDDVNARGGGSGGGGDRKAHPLKIRAAARTPKERFALSL
jgi:hypothetical protein